MDNTVSPNSNPVGHLLEADELFCHQIMDSFACVGTTDRDWTEKVCAMAMARDGSLQLGFGLGKYPNRNVMDCYAGISRGKEQITVRASRQLSPKPNLTAIGPIRYEVVEPLNKVRFILEPNEVQPIAFDCLFEGRVPARFEDRSHIRQGYRVMTELVRYHQTGVASGWIEVDGIRSEITSEHWVSTRDHSWGVRYGVGRSPGALEPANDGSGEGYEFFWSPSYLERADGSHYALFLNFSRVSSGQSQTRTVMSAVEHPDGRVERIVDIVPDLDYDPANRRLRGGQLDCTMADGSVRVITLEAMSETGFHLGAGLYFGFEGNYHGDWRGKRHADGERIDDCTTFENTRRLHQIRDTVIRIHDPVGGGSGWGNWQPIIIGDHRRSGLKAADSFW
ncbi:MAG: hypothetical protein IPO61_01650 [Gammaproteobacteria bacterium]|nr:hypothetical protein [Gammaproteobacteria bacterium]